MLQLSKQELIFGPMQIGARINQDQTISKDLTLWNQQGSQVLRGQILVLPVGNTFLYVDPIYIQATEARMPQLKKVVLAVGNRLIYADTYDQALAQLTTGAQALVTEATATAPGSPPKVSRGSAHGRCAIAERARSSAPVSRTGGAGKVERGGEGVGGDRGGGEAVVILRSRKYCHAGLLGGFLQLCVQGCEWRAVTDRQLQIGGVIG